MKRYIFAALYLWCGVILVENTPHTGMGTATMAAAVVVLPALAGLKLVLDGKISD